MEIKLMPRWKTIELWGRGLVLVAAFLEIFVLGHFESKKLDARVYTIIENQAYQRYLTDNLTIDDPNERATRMAENFNSAQLYSQIQGYWSQEIYLARWVFAVFFGIGSVLLVVARAKEPV